ncbi:RES family NAD+ phosphorylase [Fulvivirga lutea]|uniref:RES family NAD+ phosphorylase n=1 Tax=Fulvivirga lutea TaxID=2810512 RepID=A0A974WJI2_9BACT|nr:RES family NAD+ phosphorylase [Fulvivirga lutea]QSE97310.1 RES family NAD+ phosphorylase [Fulvivirga lutea]
MIVYRIVHAEFANKIVASGRPARWNSAGTFVVYTASSRSLACLENLVHRSSEGLNAQFRTLVIEIPETIVIEEVTVNDLPKNWPSFKSQLQTRHMGDKWAVTQETCVLRVPSVIIPEESNYLINPQHLDFKKIKLLATEEFLFDNRFKSI